MRNGSFNDFAGFNLGKVGPNFFANIRAMESNGDLNWAKQYSITGGNTEAGTQIETIPDGFIIRGGNANASSGSPHTRSGGGWFNTHYQGSGNPRVLNCVFEDNKSDGNGGLF